MTSFERELAVAVDAARRAGAEILAAWPRSGTRSTSAEVGYKGAVDLVTETDTKCEDIVIGALVKAFPDDDVVGEETHAMSGEAEVKRTTPTRRSSSVWSWNQARWWWTREPRSL